MYGLIVHKISVTMEYRLSRNCSKLSVTWNVNLLINQLVGSFNWVFFCPMTMMSYTGEPFFGNREETSRRIA